MGADLPAGSGKMRVRSDPSGAQALYRIRSARLTRPDACGRSIEQKLDGQVFWLSARSGYSSPSQTFTRPVAFIEKPGRSQRRPRNGFAPFSLLSPMTHRGTCRKIILCRDRREIVQTSARLRLRARRINPASAKPQAAEKTLPAPARFVLRQRRS